jgi:hypothetical protein
MIRLVVSLYQWIKRSPEDNASSDSQGYSRDFNREESEGSRWTFVSIFAVFTLSLYILAGLGYYAKVHVWDEMSEQQKEVVSQAMVVSSQNL